MLRLAFVIDWRAFAVVRKPGSKSSAGWWMISALGTIDKNLSVAPRIWGPPPTFKPTSNPSFCKWVHCTLAFQFHLRHLSGLGRFPRLLLWWARAIRVYRCPEGCFPHLFL